MTSSASQTSAAEPHVLRAVIDATRLLVITLDLEGSITSVNRAFERTTGYARADWARPIWELAVLANERARLRAMFSSAREQPLPPTVLFRMSTSGEATRVVEFDLRLIHDDRGVPTVVLAGVDLTEHMLAGREVKETAVLQQTILEALPGVLWTTDCNLRMTFIAGGGMATMGLHPNETAALGSSLPDYLGADHPAVAAHRHALAGESGTYEFRWEYIVFQMRVGPFRDREGRIIGCIGAGVDVTDQVRAAEALKDSEQRLRRLMESDVIGIVFWEQAGRITQANNAFLEMLGYTRDELSSGALVFPALTPADYSARDERALAEIEATGKCDPFEKAYFSKSGERVPALVGAASFNRPGGGPLAGVSFVLDLREQVGLRKARDLLLLQEQQARLETQLANARLLLLVAGSQRLSRTMRIDESLAALAEAVVPDLADWSYVIHRGWDGRPPQVASAQADPNAQPLLRQLQGWAPDPDAPIGPARVFRSGETECHSDITPEQLCSNAAQWPVVGTRDPGRLKIVRGLGMRSLLCVPIHGRGQVDAVLLLASATDPQRYHPDDIVLAQELAARAAVNLENSRLLTEALDAIRVRDEFLAVAAHELRTPLTSLLLQVQLLESGLEHGRFAADSALRGVHAAETQARRLSLLIDRLLDVARLATDRMKIHVEELDLSQLVRAVVAAQSEELHRAGCAVEVSTSKRIVGRWDRMRIEQVLTNLLSNAMRFGAGRPIEITASATTTTARIAVRDHGIGISPEDQARIFDRFERAVSVRHFGGLGLGLYISAQSLRAHGGTLRVESKPGEGALFVVELPRSPALAAKGSAVG